MFLLHSVSDYGGGVSEFASHYHFLLSDWELSEDFLNVNLIRSCVEIIPCCYLVLAIGCQLR